MNQRVRSRRNRPTGKVRAPPTASRLFPVVATPRPALPQCPLTSAEAYARGCVLAPRRDEHALDLSPVLSGSHYGPVSHGSAIEPSDEERHIGFFQSPDVQHVI